MDATSAGMIGKYQVIRVLGRGGMGEVLLAQDDLGRRVAIKRPFKSALEDGLARFKVEARAATLNHPNIPVVYEMGTQDGLPYIAMEFVEGDPLDKLIASGNPTDLITKLSIIEQVCSGLGYAHQKGIIHRDIKPANVILQPNGVAKIIDFGIAKIQNVEMTSALTQTSQIIGSLHYIAPERFKGEMIDGRVDIFSAGVMLYLLLTGQLPFAGGEATASYRIVNEAHTALSAHLRNYPPALDAILDQALAKNQNDRYSTAEDFADALHEVIDELKKTRIDQLVDDAERLNMEGRYAPALELLDEAKKLDPANTQVRKLHRLVREHQDRQKRGERLRETVGRANEALAAENYAEALALLKEAQRMDPTFPEIRERIQFAEDKKRQSDRSVAALAEAEAAKGRGDITAALRIIERALPEDAENSKLLAMRGALAKQLENEALQSKVLSVLDAARMELSAQHFPAVEQLLAEAEAIDRSHPRIDELRRELSRSREQEERRRLLEEIHRRVNEFIKVNNYDQAADLLNRAIDKLPTETGLHRLKLDVDTGARKYTSKLFIDGAISSARELYATAPLEALAGLQQAIEQMPGEERLTSYERTLRQQFEGHRVEQLLGDTLRRARELLAERHFDKAIGVLESYHLEFGAQADIDDLLNMARNELASKQRRIIVERTTAEVRSLLRSERQDDAIRLLESVLRDSPDANLSRLLDEVREQQIALVRKLEVVQKRVSLLRERGELDEAIRILEEYLAATPASPRVQELLAALQAEREQKQVTQEAIASARLAAERRDFPAGLESLQAVVRAYGESAELTAEIQQVETKRAAVAQEMVAASVKTAQAAILKNDPEGALAALASTRDVVEFADQPRQAEWRRLLQDVKKARPGTNLDAPAAVAPPPALSKTLVWSIAGAGLAAVLVVGLLVWKMQKTPVPAGPVEAHIVIAKAPPGANVSVDGKAPVLTDALGNASIVVSPGAHKLVVSKAGFGDFKDDVTVGAGETYRDPAQLALLPPMGKSGTLAVHGNVPKFKVFVDGVPAGFKNAGEAIPLEVGVHKIQYTAPGFEDSQSQTVTIALNKQTQDTFTLLARAAPPPNLGNLIIQTNPGAHVSIDGGQHAGVASADGNFTINGLTPTGHTISAQLDGYLPVQGKAVTLQAGQNITANVQMTPIPPSLVNFSADTQSIESGKPVKLSWQVNNATSVSIDPIGTVPVSGSTTVYPEQNVSYKLTANGSVLKELEVKVSPRLVVQQAPPVVVAPPAKPAGPPEVEALLPAIAVYKGTFASASGKGTKECQGVLNGAYKGKLRGLSEWCELAKGFDVTDNCESSASGSPDAPVLSCSEELRINLKSGGSKAVTSRRSFKFLKNAEGSWSVVSW